MVLQVSLGHFYGIDSLVELGIIIVAIMISYQSRKIYKIVNEKRYNYFAWAFLFIAISFIFKIVSNLTIINKVYIENLNIFAVFAHELREMQLINFFSFTIYKFFCMLGFLTLFFVTSKIENREKIFLYLYFGIVTILFSIYFNLIFYASIVLIVLFLTEFFYRNYKKIKTRNSLLVFLAFLLILASYVLSIFEGIHPIIYLIDELLLLSGFIIFLVNQFLIKNEKKNKIRSYKGYTSGFKKQ